MNCLHLLRKTLVAVSVALIFGPSLIQAQGTGGGGGNFPPGIAGYVQNISGTSASVTVDYHANYSWPFSGGPWKPELLIGKRTSSENSEVELVKKIVIPDDKAKGPADHSITVNVKLADGEFYAIFNTDSDQGPNAEFQMFGSYFEIINGVVVWTPNDDIIGAGGNVVQFPFNVSPRPFSPCCGRSIPGSNLTIQCGPPSMQGDSRQDNPAEAARDKQTIFDPKNALSSCGPCGGSGSGSPVGVGLFLELMSDMENIAIPTGAGLAYGSVLTDEAYLVTDVNGSIIARIKHDRIVTTAKDADHPTAGVAFDEFKQFKEVRFYNGSALTGNMAMVNRMEVEFYDGSVKKYAVENDDEDVHGDKYAYMTEWKDRNDHGIVFDRNTGIVTGPFGETMVVNMGTVIAGRDSISSVTLSPGTNKEATVNFEYTGFYLSKVEVTDTSQNVVYRWENSVSIDPETGGLIWETSHPAMGRTRTLYSPDHGIGQDGHFRSYAANRVARFERGQAGSEQLSLTIQSIANEPTGHLIAYGNVFAKMEQRLGQWQKFEKENGSYEGTYALNWFDPIGGAIGPPPEHSWVVGAADHRINEDGVRVDIEYDADNFVTKRVWGEGETYETFELIQYDQFKNVTFHRDRNGCVTTFVYNSKNLLIEKHVGQKDADGDGFPDLPNPPEYGVYSYTYNANDQLEEARDPLYDASKPLLHRTRYEYDSNRRLVLVQEAAFSTGGATGNTSFSYNSQGLVSSVTDPMNRTTTFEYDILGRLIKKTFNDSSTEETLYGSSINNSVPNTGMKVVATKDRNNVVTMVEYDWLGRRIQTVVGAAIDSTILDGVDNLVSDPLQKSTSTYSYISGLDLVDSETTDGRTTDIEYDYRMRPVETSRYPNSTTTLTSKTVYINNQVFYTEDPYGRKKFFGYRAHDGQLIRTVQGAVPSYSRADNQAVLDTIRDLNPNAKYVVADAIKDPAGQLVKIIDGRGIETELEYDCRGRQTKRTEAVKTNVERSSVSIYDAANNLVEQRSPRYFDPSDTRGYTKSKTVMTYNGRNLLSSRTEAPGTPEAATTQQSYFLDGRNDTLTDERGFNWGTDWHNCCGRFLGTRDPAGHGNLANTDYLGRVTHAVVVSDYASHLGNPHDPADAATISETTTRFDALGRRIMNCDWLDARGNVNPNNPPIAGLDADGDGSLDGTLANGLPLLAFYDSNLADGIGLDSNAGISIPRLGNLQESYYVSLNALLSDLANDTGISFGSGSAGFAVLIVNAEEELTVGISDGIGRSVMFAQLQPRESGEGANLGDKITWNYQTYDTIRSIPNFGSVLEHQSKDAAGFVTRMRTDGIGRNLENLDAENNQSIFQFDAAGNVVQTRDPNGVGLDTTYDEHNRAITSTDTYGDSTTSAYDLEDNTISWIDSKAESSKSEFDARGRRINYEDRLGGITTFNFDAAGNLLFVADAEMQITGFEYDDRGLRIKETFPDHATGASPGDANYSIRKTEYDAAARPSYIQDQNGDWKTFTYDLAGRMTSRQYRNYAAGKTGPISDADTFSYDRASRVLSAHSGRYGNNVSISYDVGGRIESESKTIKLQTYETKYSYENRGLASELTYPNGTVVSREYNSLGLLATVRYQDTWIHSRNYDPGGRLIQTIQGNNVVTDFSYRNNSTGKDNSIAAINHVSPKSASAAIGNYTYTWNPNKKKLSESISGTLSGVGIQSVTYDAEDRLKSWSRFDGSLSISWDLSIVGDWNSVTKNGSIHSRTHGSSHELLASAGGSVIHDAKGNIKSIPPQLRIASTGIAMAWDFDNQLVSVDADNNGEIDIHYEYDALGRLVKNGSTVYVHAGHQVIAEYVEGAAATSPSELYVYGTYVDEPLMKDGSITGGGTGKLYYHRNQQYSVIALTDENGSPVERYSYDSHGNLTIYDSSGTIISRSTCGNPYTFTGRRYDENTELYYFRARFYSPILGRFISRDPLGYSDGMSLYANYFQIDATDPTGLKCDLEELIEEYFLAIIRKRLLKFAAKYGAKKIVKRAVATGAGIAMADSPAPGPGDLVAIGYGLYAVFEIANGVRQFSAVKEAFDWLKEAVFDRVKNFKQKFQVCLDESPECCEIATDAIKKLRRRARYFAPMKLNRAKKAKLYKEIYEQVQKALRELPLCCAKSHLPPGLWKNRKGWRKVSQRGGKTCWVDSQGRRWEAGPKHGRDRSRKGKNDVDYEWDVQLPRGGGHINVDPLTGKEIRKQGKK